MITDPANAIANELQVAEVTVTIPWGAWTARVYAIPTTQGVVLVDCGHDSAIAWDQLRQGLAAHKWSPSDVCAVLLTHSHADHSGLAPFLSEQFGATLYVHRSEQEAVEQQSRLWGRARRCTAKLLIDHGMPRERAERLFREREDRARRTDHAHPGRIDHPAPHAGSGSLSWRALGDGDSIAFGNLRLAAIHCPGHSPGSTVYWHAGSGTLFSGDHILPRVSSTPLYFANDQCEQRTRSLPDYLASLDKVERLLVRRILPGHGSAIEDPAGAIGGLRRHHSRRTERVFGAMTEKPGSVFDLLPAVFPHLAPDHVIIGMVDVICHMDVMVDAGRVVEENRNGRYYYRVAVRS